MKKFAAGSSCEFMSEFGSLLPSYIFLELMGMPRELLPQFLEWENTFLRGETVQARINAVREVYDYLQRYTAEKRQNPGDDLVSKVVAGKIDGRKITETEILGLCMTLYLGGLDTVANSLGWHLRHLARDQALQKRLKANPELIPAAVDELLRAYGVTSTNRTVAEDMEFHGVPMRRGDVVGMPAFFACRDPREYPDPHVVNLERKQRNVTFGTGIHNCIGIHLAKREIRIVLTEFLSRFENIRIPEGSNEILTTEGVWGVKELPLVWDRV
jgi:cytochrome P450